MSAKANNVILWLFVINLGISFGAGLYEARIEFPQWLVTSRFRLADWISTKDRHWRRITSTIPCGFLATCQGRSVRLVTNGSARWHMAAWWLTSASASPRKPKHRTSMVDSVSTIGTRTSLGNPRPRAIRRTK